MNVKISNCYYHTDRPAVGVCAQCGAGICRECAVKDDSGRIICYKCGNRNLKQEHREYREMLKQQGGRFRNGKEFIVPGIIGILIAVISLLVILLNEYAHGMTPGIGELIPLIIMAYMFFSIPFCMIMLNDRFAPRYDTLHNQFGTWAWKVMLSLFIGWIVFTFYLIRFIVAKIKSR